MIQLRDYQEDLLYSVQVALAEEKARVMMQLPTGGGKTVIAGTLRQCRSMMDKKPSSMEDNP